MCAEDVELLRRRLVVPWRDVDCDADSVAAEGFKQKYVYREWSTEERELLVKGLQKVAAGDLVPDTKNLYQWLSHHIMDCQRSPFDCKIAVKKILQYHTEFQPFGGLFASASAYSLHLPAAAYTAASSYSLSSSSSSSSSS